MLHAIAVPAFLLAGIGFIVAAASHAWLLALGVVARSLAEQWITFPWFVVSGSWWAALRGRPRI